MYSHSGVGTTGLGGFIFCQRDSAPFILCYTFGSITHTRTRTRPLLMKFMFLVTRMRVILIAVSIGHYWSRDLHSVPQIRLCFEIISVCIALQQEELFCYGR